MPYFCSIRRILAIVAVFIAFTSGTFALRNMAGIVHGEVVASSLSIATTDIEDELTRRDIELIDKALRLDESQREIAAALFDGYAQQINKQSTAHRTLIQSLYQEAQRAADRQPVNDRIAAAQEQWTATRIRLNNEMIESIKAMLTQSQLERWPVVERDRRRRTTLNVSPRFYAENVDLIDLADALKLNAKMRDVIDPALNTWAEELDGLLQARKAAQGQWARIVEEPLAAGTTPDPATRQELSDRLNHQSLAIRNLNLRHASLISAQLPSPANGDYRAAFNLAAYPIIYRATPADRYLDSAFKLPDLSAEQIQAIKSIESDYDSQVLIINDQLAIIMRRQEDANPQREQIKRAAFEGLGGVTIDADGNALIGNLNGVAALSVTTPPRPGGDDLPRVIVPGLDRAEPDSPQGRLEQGKRALMERTIASVFDILNPDQQAACPKPTAAQMLSPEEKMRRVMEKAFSTAVITRNADGSVTFNLTVEADTSPDQ